MCKRNYVVLDLPNFLDFAGNNSPDLLRSICFMPSATSSAGLALNLLQNETWALTASSTVVIFRSRLNSSLTASEQSPQSHFPEKLALTLLM